MRCIVSGPRDQDLAPSSGACSSNSHSVCRREKAELDAEHERALSWNGGTAIYEDYCGSVARILRTVQSERLYSPVGFFFRAWILLMRRIEGNSRGKGKRHGSWSAKPERPDADAAVGRPETDTTEPSNAAKPRRKHTAKHSATVRRRFRQCLAETKKHLTRLTSLFQPGPNSCLAPCSRCRRGNSDSEQRTTRRCQALSKQSNMPRDRP